MSNFQNILDKLTFDLKKVDEIILEFSVGKSPLIQEISTHLIASGGKRIRPLLLLLSAKLFNKKPIHNLAAALELIHTATLLHDDVVDVSQIRRGKKTANAIWDNKPSILVGDYLFSISFQLMVRSQNLQVLDLLSRASSTMADGEVMQLENSSDVELSEEKYLEIIFGKTAVLFSAACEVAALFNCADLEKISALREFGKNLGIVFQILDDMLDYSSKEDVLGKDLGNDFFEGKVTLPIILTYQKASIEDQNIIKKLFEKNLIENNKSQADFEQILFLIEKYQGFVATKERALYHKSMAVKNLEVFLESSAKSDLIAVLEYASARLY